MNRIVLLALLCLPMTAGALPPSTWLVSVGNNAGDPTEVTLLYAESDAERMASTLRRHGGLTGARSSVLAGEGAGSLRAALAAAERGLGQVPPGEPSALIVYYSGHADEHALHLGGEHVPLDELREQVAASRAKFRLLIIDACRSGAVTRVKGVAEARDFQVDMVDRVATEGLAIITSSTAGEASQESDRLRGSFFSHHLLNAMRGAGDRDGDAKITLAEAYSYAYGQTVRSSGQTLVVQHPTYAYDMKGHGDLVLTTVAARQGGTAGLLLDAAVDYLVTEAETGAVVAELRAHRPDALLALAPRRYHVQQRGADEYREYAVDLTAGRTLALADLPHRSVRYDRLVRQRGGTRTVVHGLRLLSAARGEVLAGEGVSPSLALGYGVDLPWFSAGLRVHAGLAEDDRTFQRRRRELGVGLTLERVTDLDALSVSFGLLAEVAQHRQTFATAREAEPVSAIGGTFGGLLAVERALFGGMSLRLEGGPATVVLPVTDVEDGAPVDDTVRAVFTWWGGGGLVWRL